MMVAILYWMLTLYWVFRIVKSVVYLDQLYEVNTKLSQFYR